MLAITIACAAMCFAVVVRHSHDLQQATLNRELHNQAELIGSEIANQRHEGERLVASQAQVQLTAQRFSGNNTELLREALHEWSDRRLHLSRGLLAIEVVDATGQRLLQSGSIGPPASAVVPLDAHTRIEIGNDARLAIERTLPADESGRGSVTRMQFALPRLTAALLDDASNAAFDTAICHALSQHSMQCLRLSPSALASLPVAREITGRRGALDLAFNGKSGVTLGAEPDGARFFAAYGPIGSTPLVMSLTTRLDTLYADLRQRLNALLSLMLGLVAAATCILWWQIAPLIAKVVTARSRANDQATRLAMLFDSVEDAIVVFNLGGTIESWNRGAQHLFGYSAEDIIGKDARLLLPEPHASKLSHYIQSSARVQLTGRMEMEGRHGSGRLVPIEVSLREMVTNGQRLYVAVMHDISVRREVDRMKSEFVSTISHELRTPLTSIAGSLALISGGAAGETPPKVARLVGIARQNSERLIRLINDILDLEKAEAGKLDFQLSVRSLRAEVASVAEFNRGFGQGLGVAIELEDGDDAEVLIDSDRLTQVLTNLISNAAKFSPPGGMVRIRIEREADDVRVTVSDTGPGVPLEFQPRIFQKFAQADASDSRLKGGTGLGLSIAKSITEQLGGRIGFDSVPGQGTTFYIVLPIHTQASGELQPKHDKPTLEVERTGHDRSGRGEGVPQVLHVEDDQSLTDIVREAMSRNAVVTSARSIAAARQQLAEKHFDAVILDVALPDGLGVDLLPIAARDGQRRPIIVSYTADEPSRALRASVDVALVKSRHSVNQLMVTVLAHVGDDDSTSPAAARQVNSHP
jgi:PAS domain S-box-containing protein